MLHLTAATERKYKTVILTNVLADIGSGHFGLSSHPQSAPESGQGDF